MYLHVKVRPAIAMIELIFAIVVIGITMLSAPLILNQSIQSSNTAMQQEAISAAGSQIALILTRHWDEQDSNATFGYGIIAVSNSGDSELTQSARDTNNSALNMNRRFNTPALQATLTANLGFEALENNNPDDVDDFHRLVQNLNLYSSTEEAKLEDNEGEYVDTGIQMTNTVAYGVDAATYTADPVIFNNPFAPAAGTTNIKLINVRLRSQRTDVTDLTDISLSAFVCNIGNAAYGRTLPMVP